MVTTITSTVVAKTFVTIITIIIFAIIVITTSSPLHNHHYIGITIISKITSTFVTVTIISLLP